MMKKRLTKTLAVLVVGALLSTVVTYSALATPDEWIPAKGLYLEPAVQDSQPVSISPKSHYVVRRGDTLITVAGKFGISLDRLMENNQLQDADRIREGQVLQIPGSVYTHTVAPGETLSVIADKLGVTIDEIISTNGLANQDFVLVGQKLTIIQNSDQLNVSVENPVSRSLPVGLLAWPVTGWISSPFGFREGRPHEGVDIAADEGDPIKAAMAGRVSFSGAIDGYGLTVILDHGNGVQTLYGHSSKLLVKEGDWVNQGQLIARVGNTGRSNGPHLHLELRLNNVPYDPLLCLGRARA